MKKEATSSFPVHKLIAERWSPRAFESRAVEREHIGSLLEAARWAPSCFNEQPWVFLVAPAEQEDEFKRLASCLLEGNAWAKQAPLLMLSVAKLTFDRNGEQNRHALHDVGLAVENLVIQAQALGLAVHQMAGFDSDKARDVLRIPEGFDPVAMLAVGYPGSAEMLSDELKKRELAPRSRKDLAAFVFGARWDSEYALSPE